MISDKRAKELEAIAERQVQEEEERAFIDAYKEAYRYRRIGLFSRAFPKVALLRKSKRAFKALRKIEQLLNDAVFYDSFTYNYVTGQRFQKVYADKVIKAKQEAESW